MTDSTRPTVAVLGLGVMGHAFAANLLAAGFPTRVWNRSADKAADLGAAGAEVAASPAKAVDGAEIVITMLSTPEVTSAVLLDPELTGTLGEGTVLVQMGTIGPQAVLELEAALREAAPGVGFVDAPVAGSKGPAEKGLLTILVGGDEGAHGERLAPVFDVIGKRALWLGPVGAGSKMKLVINAWLVMFTESLAETAQLADKLGFDAETFSGVLDGGPLCAPFALSKLKKMGARDFSTEMALKWGLKDARLAIEAAEDLVLPGLANVSQRWARAARFGHEWDDISSAYELEETARA